MLFYPVRFSGLPGARPGARSATLLPRRIQQIPGVDAGRRRLAGDHPVAGGEDGLDRRRQGDRQARQRRPTSTSSSSPTRSPSTSSPRPAATSATWSTGSWSASTRSCGATCRRACARRSTSGSRTSSPRSSATVTDEIGDNIDQLLDVKLMVIRHIEEHPELANRIFLEVGRRELRFIINFGFFFGFAARDPDRLPHRAPFTQWWVLPICGVIDRLRHQLGGDLDDLRAGRAAPARAAPAPGALPAPPAARWPRSTPRSSPTTSSRSRNIGDELLHGPARGPHAPDDRGRDAPRRRPRRRARRRSRSGWPSGPASTTRSASRWPPRPSTTR